MFRQINTVTKPRRSFAKAARGLLLVVPLALTAGCFDTGTNVVAEFQTMYPISGIGSGGCATSCKAWVSACKIFAGADNHGYAADVRAYAKVLQADCNTLTSDNARVACLADLKADRNEALQERAQDTATASAVCEGSSDECLEYCVANS
jgi:hypothetical protein